MRNMQINAEIESLTTRKAAQRYINAHQFLNELRRSRSYITPEQFSQLRVQALSGDVVGARKNLVSVPGLTTT